MADNQTAVPTTPVVEEHFTASECSDLADMLEGLNAPNNGGTPLRRLTDLLWTLAGGGIGPFVVRADRDPHRQVLVDTTYTGPDAHYREDRGFQMGRALDDMRMSRELMTDALRKCDDAGLQRALRSYHAAQARAIGWASA